MKKKLSIIILLLLTSAQVFSFQKELKTDNKKPKQDECYKCHKENNALPGDFNAEDVHSKLTCASCHGGDASNADMSVAMDPSKGFIGAPKKNEIPKFCARCHSNINIMREYQPRIATDQLAQYSTSMHGKKLAAGDLNVAQCASCHTAHSILPVKDPRATVYKLNVPETCNKCHGNKELMDKYKLPSNHLAEYKSSVHGEALFVKKDLGAPVCNDCHGNHGATPPGVTSISRVCGTCHVKNLEFFDQSTMAKAFQQKGYHACEQCHSNHAIKKPTDDMVGVGPDSKCVSCHKQGTSGYLQSEKLGAFISSLKKNYETANIKYLEVKEKGMNDIDIGFVLQDAKQNIIQLRTLIHTFDSTKVGSFYRDGMEVSNKALKLADNEISEYYTRRNGFAAATGVFLLIIVVLYIKIRERQKKRV